MTPSLPPSLDPLEEMARDLRRRVGGEFRAEREAAEAEADLLARRRLTIVDVARAAAHRGDVVEVRVASRAFRGEVVGVGPDHLWLRNGAGSVHVALAALHSLRRIPASGAGVPANDPGSIRALLRASEMDNRRITLLGDDGSEFDGVVRTCASDHLVVADDAGETIVPLGHVAAVIDHSDTA